MNLEGIIKKVEGLAETISKKRLSKNKDVPDEELVWEMGYYTYRPWVYVVIIIGGLFFKIVAFFWLYTGLKNLFKKNYKPYYLERTEEKSLFLNINVVENGRMFVKRFSYKPKALDKKQKVFCSVKGLVCLSLGFTLMALSSGFWGWINGPAIGVEVKEKKRSRAYSNFNLDRTKLNYPVQVRVSYPVGTRLFSDTTINYSVLDTLKKGEIVEVDTVLGDFFVVYENDTCFLYTGHVRVLKNDSL